MPGRAGIRRVRRSLAAVGAGMGCLLLSPAAANGAPSGGEPGAERAGDAGSRLAPPTGARLRSGFGMSARLTSGFGTASRLSAGRHDSAPGPTRSIPHRQAESVHDPDADPS